MLVALAALVSSIAAVLLAGWQVILSENDVARRAWSVRRVDLGEAGLDRRGVEVELSIMGRAVLYEVTPFTTGEADVRIMGDAVPRLDCTSAVIRFCADVPGGAAGGDEVWFGVTWLTARRRGQVHVEHALRVNARTGEVQQWLWRRGPIPLTWRSRGSGRWGTRAPLFGRETYRIADAEPTPREGAQSRKAPGSSSSR